MTAVAQSSDPYFHETGLLFFARQDISDKVDYGHADSVRPMDSVDMIVIHSSHSLLRNKRTGTIDSLSTEGVLRLYRRYDVAPHYLIDRSGRIIRMVDEEYAAWHAGKSRLPIDTTGLDSLEAARITERSINRTSIGIEIINTPETPPSEAQYLALQYLIECICKRLNIAYIVGHSHIAPERKTDPWLLDWQRLLHGPIEEVYTKELTGLRLVGDSVITRNLPYRKE